MASASNRHRAVRVVAAAVAGGLVVAAIGLVMFTRHHSTQGPVRQAATGQPISSAVAVPVPGLEHALVAGSYRELATYASSGRAQRIFTARSTQRPAWPCVGLAEDEGISLSCSATVFPDRVMHVHRTIIGDERLLSGIVAPAVTQVSFVETFGRTTTVAVVNGTFLFSGTGGQGRLEARDRAGNVLFEKTVLFSG